MVEAVRAASAALVVVVDAASDAEAVLTDRAVLVPVVIRLHAHSDDRSTEILIRMVEKRHGHVDF
jgi:hypothetical protein